MSIAQGGNSMNCVLDARGKLVGTLPEFARDPAELLKLYRTLVLTRTFDAKAVSMQRTGRLGTYAPRPRPPICTDCNDLNAAAPCHTRTKRQYRPASGIFWCITAADRSIRFAAQCEAVTVTDIRTAAL